jgi:hypothetical protein
MKNIKSINEWYKQQDLTKITFSVEKTYVDKVFDNLMDIICQEKGISEKSFKDIDNTRNYLESFFDNNSEILLEIDVFNSHKERTKYCAEYLYSKWFI